MTAAVAAARTLLPDIAASLRAKARQIRMDTTPEMARSDRAAFVRLVMVDERGEQVHTDAFTRMFCDSWGHLYSKRKNANRQHMSLTAPPGLGKSSLARMMSLYEIGQDMTSRVVITSGDMGDATNAVSLCRQIAMTPAFQEVFPGCEPDAESSSTNRGWTQKSWFLKSAGQQKDPTMQAMPAVPKRESVRITMLIADDIVTHKTFEGADHEKICGAFFNTYIEGRLRLGGICLYLQNLRGKNDLLHRLRENPKFVSIWAGVTADCERMFVKLWNAPDDYPIVAHPERYGINRMDSPDNDSISPGFYGEMDLPVRPGYTKEDLLATTPGSFKTMFRLQGLDPTDLMMPGFVKRTTAPMTIAQMLGLLERDGLAIIPPNDQFRFRIVAGLDLSGQRRKGTSFFCIARDSRGLQYPLELWSIAGDYGDLIKRLDDAWCRGLRWEALVVESNGVQDTIRDAIKTTARDKGLEWSHTITGTVTGSNKWDPQLGLPGLDLKFQNGVYVWPELMATSAVPVSVREHWQRAEQEWSVLTRDASRTTTPDSLMACWFADAGMAKRGAVSNEIKPAYDPIDYNTFKGY